MKDELLISIAETGYNVGFGAKKHFATYDIVNKIPGIINIFAISFGIYALVFESLTAKSLSASILVLGVIGLYISSYEPRKSLYERAGVKLTGVYNNLGQLYREVKASQSEDLSTFETRHSKLRDEYYEHSLSDQILFSDWYAHYKFFWQHQINWINDKKQFKFFRDKIPLSFIFFVILIVSLLFWQFDLTSLIWCRIVDSCP